jgi:hypothetical protein
MPERSGVAGDNLANGEMRPRAVTNLSRMERLGS